MIRIFACCFLNFLWCLFQMSTWPTNKTKKKQNTKQKHTFPPNFAHFCTTNEEHAYNAWVCKTTLITWFFFFYEDDQPQIQVAHLTHTTPILPQHYYPPSAIFHVFVFIWGTCLRIRIFLCVLKLFIYLFIYLYLTFLFFLSYWAKVFDFRGGGNI